MEKDLYNLLDSNLTHRQQCWEATDCEGPAPYSVAISEINREIRCLLQRKREINILQNHIHDWNEDDYCNICGADGRA